MIHETKKILLLIIVGISPIMVWAQMGDQLYRRLPDSVRPAERARPSYKEVERILSLMPMLDQDPTLLVQFDQFASSFANLYKSVPEKEKRVAFLQSISHYWYHRNYRSDSSYSRFIDSAYKYNMLEQSNIGSDTVGLKNQLADFYLTNGTLLIAMEKYSSGFDQLRNSLNIYLAEKNFRVVGYINSEISFLYFRLKFYEKSIIYGDSALRYLWASNFRTDNDHDYREIGSTMANQMDNYSILYAGTKQPRFADSVRKTAALIMADTNINQGIVKYTAYSILSYLSYQEGNYINAITYADSSFYLRNDSTYDVSLIYNFVYKGLSLLKLGKPEAGIALLKKVDIKRRSNGIIPALEQMYKYEKEKGNYNKALEYHEQLMTFTAEENTMKYRGVVFEMEQRYGLSAKQQEINKLEESGERNKWIAGFVLFAVVSVASITYILYRNNKARADQLLRRITELTELQLQQIEDAESRAKYTERKKIGQDLHDDFSASLAGTLQFLRLKSQKEKDPSEQQQTMRIVSMLEDSYSRARAKSHEVFESETTDNFWGKLSDNINLFFSGADIQTNISIDGSDMANLVPIVKTTILYTIKELVTNILKHAKASMVDILIYNDNGRIHIEVRDNGRGISQGDKRNNLGLASIRERTINLKGEFHIHPAIKGTFIEIVLPVSKIQYEPN